MLRVCVRVSSSFFFSFSPLGFTFSKSLSLFLLLLSVCYNLLSGLYPNTTVTEGSDYMYSMYVFLLPLLGDIF